jgi:hypothetical protein
MKQTHHLNLEIITDGSSNNCSFFNEDIKYIPRVKVRSKKISYEDETKKLCSIPGFFE